MRCPTCGTDNAQDSRFCGGCGARFGAAEHRVAPTAKISDDAPYPQVATPRPISQPPMVRAPTPAPVPPAQGSQPPRAATHPAASHARTAQLEESIRVPRRPMGLIVLVIIIDLALAGAGAFLLAKGLAHASAST
ncbi:MAG TPA: zinc ribbon domain-containing protein, partial [Polyangiales bacterium]